jgi:esterase/lipase superfamily enzyme
MWRWLTAVAIGIVSFALADTAATGQAVPTPPEVIPSPASSSAPFDAPPPPTPVPAPTPTPARVFYVTDRAPGRPPFQGSPLPFCASAPNCFLHYGTVTDRRTPVPAPSPASVTFESELGAALALHANAVLLYVLGCCTVFDTALDEVQRLSQEIAPNAAVIVYTIPTRGDRRYFDLPLGINVPFLNFTPGQARYFYDENVELWSVPHLEALLEELAALPSAPQIHIVAHSLGARLLLHAVMLYHLEHPGAVKRFGEIVLAAADLDRPTFVEQSPALTATAARVTVYQSDHDIAIKASASFHDSDRLGGTRGGPYTGASGIDAIDTSQVDCGSNDRSGHFYWKSSRLVMADIAAVLRGIIATDPIRTQGLKASPHGPNFYIAKRSTDCIRAD